PSELPNAAIGRRPMCELMPTGFASLVVNKVHLRQPHGVGLALAHFKLQFAAAADDLLGRNPVDLFRPRTHEFDAAAGNNEGLETVRSQKASNSMFCADLSAILPCLLGTLYRPLWQCHALSRSAFLIDNLGPSSRVFSFSGAVGKVRKIGIIRRFRRFPCRLLLLLNALDIGPIYGCR